VLYARYSDEQQRDSWSIEAQVNDLRAYCERLGWAVYEEVCVDEAITGKTEDRPGLLRAMALIREGRANVLVVHKLDRFFRNMAKTFEYVAELEEYGAGLVCTQQPIDTTNPVSGKIVLAVMAALAEIYLDNLSEEVSKGKRARAAAGLPNGDLPYGYVVSRAAESRGANNRAVAEIVPEEAAAVHQAFEWYATGQIGEAAIAHRLNDHGYRMRSKRQRTGGVFTRDTVRSMLHNPFYAGWVLQPSEEPRSWAERALSAARERGMHQPIIAQELYDRVQRVRTERWGTHPTGKGHRAAAPKRFHAPYLAAGLVRCRHCGQRLHGQRSGAGKPSYFCTWAHRGGSCTTKRKSARAAWVDEVLGAAVGGLALPDDWRQRVLAGVETGEAVARQRESERTALERKLERLKTLLIDGDLPQREYRAERARVEQELACIAPPAAGTDHERAAALVADLGRLWEEANTEQRRELAGRAFEAVYLGLDNPGGGLQCVLREPLLPLRSLMSGCRRVIDGLRYHLWNIPRHEDRLGRAA
jgi:site-specific DNA recombinase